MLQIIFLVLIFLPKLAFANSYSSIYYAVSLAQIEASLIKVEAEIKGKLSKKLIIDLPYKWAGVDYTEQVKNIKTSNKFTISKEDGHQIIIEIPDQIDTLKISYEIHQKPGNPSHVHEAIVRPDLVHSIGYGLFATPADVTDEFLVNIKWKDIPDGWKTISSHGTGHLIKFVGNIPRLLPSIYVAGKIRTYQIGDKKNPVFLSLYGTFDIQDNIMISALSKIIKGQRSFFNDYDFPYYAISLIEGDDRYSMGGARLHDSFTAFLPKGMNKSDYYILFAHEHLHNWLGGKIPNNQQEELNYWWTEGFTDYYSRVLSLRSGVISLEEFITECNQFFRNYYLSPVLNEPNIRIKNDFRKDYDIEKLPYYRGFVFAFYLNELIKQANRPLLELGYDEQVLGAHVAQDHRVLNVHEDLSTGATTQLPLELELQKRSNENKSLDDAMLDLFKTSKGKEFSITLFKDIIKKYIPQGIDKELADFIDKGKTIDLSSLTSIVPIEKVKMGAYDLGFDRQAILEKKIIKDINLKSNAYKAGLRNGDKVIEWSFPKGQDPDQIATITTVNNIFKYRPEHPSKKEVYQFKTNLSPDDKVKLYKLHKYLN